MAGAVGAAFIAASVKECSTNAEAEREKIKKANKDKTAPGDTSVTPKQQKETAPVSQLPSPSQSPKTVSTPNRDRYR